MKYILGTKVNMTQLFDESGKVAPVTIVKAMPNVVTGIKTIDRDGYTAVLGWYCGTKGISRK